MTSSAGERAILVTAGPSREFLDEIRFISNAASGRLGIAVAAAARERGWSVHLALGPVALPPPRGVQVHDFVSAEDLDGIARELWPEVGALVATAAVCDFRPRERFVGKRKKSAGDWRLDLVRTPDVLLERSREKGNRVLVGFALETEPSLEEARRKLVEKNLDLIILNSSVNLGATEGDFQWLQSDGASRLSTGASKTRLAAEIVEFIAERWR